MKRLTRPKAKAPRLTRRPEDSNGQVQKQAATNYKQRQKRTPFHKVQERPELNEPIDEDVLTREIRRVPTRRNLVSSQETRQEPSRENSLEEPEKTEVLSERQPKRLRLDELALIPPVY